VKVVGSEFLGNGVSFTSLEVLSFELMRGWEVWSTNGRSTTGVVRDAVFPRLKNLHIMRCPSLVEFSFKGDKVFPFLQELGIKGCSNLLEISVEALASLRVLRIHGCGDGVLRSVVRAAPSVTEVEIGSISGLTNEVWRGVILDLKAVEELKVKYCPEIRYLWESTEGEAGSNLLTSLRSLDVWACENLKHLSCPSNIEKLEISSCDVSDILKGLRRATDRQKKSLKSFLPFERALVVHDLQLQSLTSLTDLDLWNCPCTDVPTAGLWPPNLCMLSIGRVKKPISEWGPQKLETATNWSQLSHHLHLPSSLTRLQINSFEKLETVSEGLQHLTSLQHLDIKWCPKMKKDAVKEEAPTGPKSPISPTSISEEGQTSLGNVNMYMEPKILLHRLCSLRVRTCKMECSIAKSDHDMISNVEADGVLIGGSLVELSWYIILMEASES
ncbi:NB-ARC domains-containing protein, partial [Tanacetum coccineum]